MWARLLAGWHGGPEHFIDVDGHDVTERASTDTVIEPHVDWITCPRNASFYGDPNLPSHPSPTPFPLATLSFSLLRFISHPRADTGEEQERSHDALVAMATVEASRALGRWRPRPKTKQGETEINYRTPVVESQWKEKTKKNGNCLLEDQ